MTHKSTVHKRFDKPTLEERITKAIGKGELSMPVIVTRLGIAYEAVSRCILRHPERFEKVVYAKERGVRWRVRHQEINEISTPSK